MSEVCVIGASCMDILCQNADERVFKDGHQHCDGIQMGYGGDGLNEAISLSALGKKVKLITRLGEDTAGKSIFEECRKRGIEIDEACLDKDVHTYIAVVLVDKKGQRNLLGTDSGSLRELSLKDISLPLSEEIKVVSFASLFISHKLSLEDIRCLFAELKKEGKIIVCDTTSPKQEEGVEELKEILPLIDYFVPNEKEAKMIAKKDSLEEAAEVFYFNGVRNVLIKAGEKGCYIRNREIRGYIEAEQVEKVVDTTGAGDAFTAGLISGLLDGKEIRECARMANHIGARAIQVSGATSWTGGIDE